MYSSRDKHDPAPPNDVNNAKRERKPRVSDTSKIAHTDMFMHEVFSPQAGSPIKIVLLNRLTIKLCQPPKDTTPCGASTWSSPARALRTTEH